MATELHLIKFIIASSKDFETVFKRSNNILKIISYTFFTYHMSRMQKYTTMPENNHTCNTEIIEKIKFLLRLRRKKKKLRHVFVFNSIGRLVYKFTLLNTYVCLYNSFPSICFRCVDCVDCDAVAVAVVIYASFFFCCDCNFGSVYFFFHHKYAWMYVNSVRISTAFTIFGDHVSKKVF